jgi:hypothetical protein
MGMMLTWFSSSSAGAFALQISFVPCWRVWLWWWWRSSGLVVVLEVGLEDVEPDIAEEERKSGRTTGRKHALISI